MEMIWMIEMQSKAAEPSLTCDYPDIIECRPKGGFPDQTVECSLDVGLDCVGFEQSTNGGSCYDYEVRIGCKDTSKPSCIEPSTTLIPIIIGEKESTDRMMTTTATTTARPIVETCLEFSEWINTFSPSAGNNDGEMINVLALKSTFETIVKIECRNTRTYQVYERDDYGIKCNPAVGFSCMAGLQPDKNCDDFEVRVAKIKDTEACKPYLTTTQAPTKVSTTTSTDVVTDDDCLEYSEWIDTHTPLFSNDEVEKISDLLRISGYSLDEVMKVECRSKEQGVLSHLAGEGATCNVDEGLVCKYRKQKDGHCDNYEVRLGKLKPLQRCGFVAAITTKTSKTAKMESTTIFSTSYGEFSRSTIPEEEECIKFGPWISTSEPDPFTGNEMELIWIVEMMSKERDPKLTCGFADVVECRTKNGKPNQIVDCNPDVGLDCSGKDQKTNGGSCYDYEVRIGCRNELVPKCAEATTALPPLILDVKEGVSEVTLITTTTTTPEPIVENCLEFSDWINTYTPVGGSNDGEAVNVLLLKSGFESIVKVECRNTVTGQTLSEDAIGVKCNTVSGLRCIADLQVGKRCDDFEVRVAKIKDSESCKTYIKTTIQPTTTMLTTTEAFDNDCLYYTDWLNTNTPYSNDEVENISDLLTISGFSPLEIVKIECRSRNQGVSAHLAGEGATCTLEEGLICKYRRQDDGRCDDYEVRLAKLRPLKRCGYTTTSTTTMTTTTLPTNCYDFDQWVDTDSPGYWQPDDIEPIDSIYEKSDTISFDADMIECREKESKKDMDATSKSVTCNLNEGFVCIADEQDDGKCLNFEVRLGKLKNLPECLPKTTEKTTITSRMPSFFKSTTSSPLVATEEDECINFGPWLSTSEPDLFSGNEMEMIWMVESQSFEADPSLTCEYPDVIECRPKNGMPDQVVECSTDVGLDCIGMEQDTNGASCYDYEVRIGCIRKEKATCVEPTTTMSPSMIDIDGAPQVPVVTTTPQPIIESCLEYSSWINTFKPSPGLNDGEAINVLLLQSEFTSIEKIECRNTKTLEVYDEDAPGIKCNTMMGFRCASSRITGGCDDFEVRVAKLKDIAGCRRTVARTTTLKPRVDMVTTTELPVEDTTCLDFSEWVNTNTPYYRSDEIERIDDIAQQLGMDKKEIVKIECRSKVTGVLSQLSEERLTCNKKEGLVCKFRRQEDGECDDYEVRVAKLKPLERCGYIETTTAFSTTTAITTTSTSQDTPCQKGEPQNCA